VKQITISIQFDEEKLKALKRFTKKKNVDFTKELEECVERLYLKYVPIAVRDYIEESDEEESTSDNKKVRKGNEK
jgi:hypothetical protein